MKSLNDQLKELHAKISIEKKERTETENALIEALKEIIIKMKEELDQEKEERESIQENLLKLLEEACMKINSTMKNS